MSNYDRYIGRILDNRYEIIELIGVGGMAYVYKALCHRLNRLVAIKILKEELSLDEEFQRRFYTESQAIAMLSHPNIVAVYDVSRSGSTEYIVMELIEGITLKQYISRKGLLNWKEVLHFTTQIAKALSHAHSRGIIHRDIKPHNIMILKDGSIKVADFGIARLLMVQNTLTQDSLGSVHYISPEQAKGGHVDARSDIYSVGVVMYEMLTSRLPFVGDTAVSVAIQHISAIPLQPRDINPDIPIGLAEITMHAMEPDADTRFITAEDMLSDLEEFRKNPAVVFNYSMSNPADRVSADMQAPYQTRVIPKEAITTPRSSVMPTVAKRQKTDLSPDEYRDAKRMSRSTATLIGVLAVLVVVILLFLLVVLPGLNDWFNPSDEMVSIPNFVDKKFDEIRINPDYIALYAFDVEYISSAEKAEGVIISQNPGANTQRRMPLDGDRIRVTLYVSTGDEPPVEMPNLIGLFWVDAGNTLGNLRLDLIVDYQQVQDDSKGNGEVVDTIPKHGDDLSRGNRVIITYAIPEDAKVVEIPDLVGRTWTFAREQLESLDIIINKTDEYDPEVLEGSVAFMHPIDATVPAGTTVYIIVSKGPPPTPTPSPTPEETPPPPPTLPPEPPPTDPPDPPPEG